MVDVATRYNAVSQYESTFPRTIGAPADMRKWEAVFGPMPDKPAPSPFSQYPVEHFQLPRAYEGENVFLAEKISGLVNTTGDFWTGRLLPWQQTDHIGPFTWTEWKFNQVLASRVPHEGVPRLVTTSEERYMARPVRRGLAAEFEGDFVNHPKGQIQMARKIQGMVVSIQTTINLDVQHTILMSQSEKRTRHLKTRITRVSIKDEINLEVAGWNAVSKSPEGFIMMARRIKRYLIRAGAQVPLVLLVTPETPIHMHTQNMPNESGEVYSVDINQRQMDDQLLRPDQTDGDFVLKDGTQVIEIRDLNIQEDAPPEQLFTRQSIIGEFNTINWIDFSKANLYDGCGEDGGKYHYCSDHRSILVHDMELDRMAKITLEECIENGGPNGFPDMGIIGTILSERNNAGGFKKSDFYPQERDLKSGARSLRGRNAHMMLFMNREVARVVHYIGNMDQNVTSHHTIRQIGQSMGAMAELTDEDVQDAIDLVSLMQELEEAPYNYGFFADLIQVNASASLRERGGGTFFQGETLSDEELIKKWGYSSAIREWKPQYHGGLKVPDQQPEYGDIIPPGLASLAGLYGLSSLNNQDSYGGIPARAKKALNLIKKLYNAWNGPLQSEFLDPNNRAPWFHPKDGMYTFFDNVIYMARDPLFLAAPGGTGANISANREPRMGLPTRPEGRTLEFNLDDSVEALRENVITAALNPGDLGPMVSGATVEPHFMTAFKLGSESLNDYIDILKRVSSAPDAFSREEINKFASTIEGTKTSSARLIIRGLNTEDDDNELKRKIRAVIGEKSSERKKIITSALNKGKQLNKDNPDQEIPGLEEGSKPLLDVINASTEPAAAGDVLDEAEAPAGNFVFTGANVSQGSFYRAPLVMTPGLARTLGIDNPTGLDVPLVLPSDPETGHTMAIRGTTIPSDFKDRPSYGTFVGASIKNRQLQHGTIGTHHFEFLAAKLLGKAQGKRISSQGGRSAGQQGLFASTTSYDDDDLFDDTSVIESLASAVRRGHSTKVGAREAYDYQEPRGKDPVSKRTFEDYASRTTKYDRRRPFSYLRDLGALVQSYGDGISEIDPLDGARLLFEMDTDNMRINISHASNIAVPIVRWGAIAAVSSRIDETEQWLRILRADILAPCNALLLRPRQTFMTDTFVMMEPGARTGGTLFNHASSMMSWDGITRRLHLNFLFYSKAMIWNPDNISLMEDAQVREYTRGAGVTFMRGLDDLMSLLK